MRCQNLRFGHQPHLVPVGVELASSLLLSYPICRSGVVLRHDTGFATVGVASEASEVSRRHEFASDGAWLRLHARLGNICREQRGQLLPVGLGAVQSVGDKELKLATWLARCLLEVIGRCRAPLVGSVASIGGPRGVPETVKTRTKANKRSATALHVTGVVKCYSPFSVGVLPRAHRIVRKTTVEVCLAT